MEEMTGWLRDVRPGASKEVSEPAKLLKQTCKAGRKTPSCNLNSRMALSHNSTTPPLTRSPILKNYHTNRSAVLL